MSAPMLSAISVSHSVSTSEGPLGILDTVNLQVYPGESVAILGASGSGKSTLLNLLAGLDTPSSGRIIFEDQDITQLGEDERAQLRADSVGFVFQSFHLIDDLNALENVALPLELFFRKDAFDIARACLNKLGLAARTSHFPRQLSGGEQQRVALARAFVVNPRLLFADEPTANLDRTTAELVLNHLFDLQKTSQTSMVVATHDQALAGRCDRVYRFIDGEFEECEQ